MDLIEEAEKLLAEGNKANFFTALETIRALVDRLKAQDATIDKLVDGLEPLANFACSPEGECDCDGCIARDLINSVTEKSDET